VALIPGANGYRLPTEDEWEYACRARTTTAFSFGGDEDLLDRYGIYARNQRNDGAHPVGSKLCNAWGLFDMHGNVREWCQDWYEEGANRVYRGGSWDSAASGCQSAFRFGCQPNYHLGDDLGFRVAAVQASK
jgi:formylglycine-generating enzyme required for sulfatase activity